MITSTRLALIIRILIALFTRTFFQPDEYFQSLEPAHHFVFGYGHLTWEWLSPRPIRSIFYPALNIPVYWILQVSGLDKHELFGDWIIVACPRIMHGVFAAATDIWTSELASRVLGARYGSTALFLSLTSFFNALSLSRSLSNSLETSLTAIAFAFYPWDASSSLSPQLIFNKSRIRKTLMFSAMACMVRPTNAVLWVFLYVRLLWALKAHSRFMIALVSEAITIGTVAALSLFILDSTYYGKPTFTPLNFVLTNLSAVSLFYGANTWHYYIFQAIPILCTTTLPFVIHGIWSALLLRRSVALQTMFTTVVWTTGVYSMAGHKEWRFLHPILPLLHIFATKSLVDLSQSSNKKSDEAKSGSKPRFSLLHDYLPPITTRFLGLIFLTVPASLFVVLLYCSAPISVISYIQSLPHHDRYNTSIGFLMPCHSTPAHAYLHRPDLAQGAMWALGCEPPLDNQNLATYRDQTDVFFDSPQAYLRTFFPSEVDPLFPRSLFPSAIPGAFVSVTTDEQPWAHEWPRYLVLFGALLKESGVKDILEERGYKEVWKKGWEWEGEGKRKGGVRVWKWSGQSH